MGLMTEQASESIGARLRSAREQSGKTLRQIADATKFGVRTLEALESEKIDRLPRGVYRRAVVRAHAREIGLNPEVLLRAFLEQYPDDLPALPPLPTRKPTSYDLPVEPAIKPRARFPIVRLFGAIVPIAAAVFYFTVGLRGEDPPRPIANLWPPRGH
jgi:cytoskeletal protein RodZ